MSENHAGVRRAFDTRAACYARSHWHRAYAERLVRAAEPVAGMKIVDAACGTGFATTVAAQAAGPGGKVVGVDISAKMLRRARAEPPRPHAAPIEWRRDDAATMSGIPAGTVDLVLCAAGLLYLPVHRALTRWRELLRPGGTVAFSTMRSGYPVAANMFRAHAGRFGLKLKDPAAVLGQDAGCDQMLRAAGFEVVRIISDTVRFTAEDLAGAWEAHVRGPHHDQLRTLSTSQREDFRTGYEAEIQQALDQDPDGMCAAQVIYAVGRA